MIVFFFSLGLLLYELCLTRVLSVFFYYHTAFLAVSLAMLGVGAGGVWAYLYGERLERGGVEGWMLATALSVILSPLLFAALRFDHALMDTLWSGGFLTVFLPVALACLLPFLFGGVVWATWFRVYRAQAATLYGWDLLGAAAGALLLVPVMNGLGGPATLLLCALLLLVVTLLAAARASHRAQNRGVRLLALGAALAVLAVGALHLSRDTLALQVDTGKHGGRVLFKQWNAFSRVVLLSEQHWFRGMSRARRAHWKGKIPEERDALIDINAFAPLIRFDGDLQKVGYLRELVSNLGHHLLPSGQDVAVLGPGGGKDVLGALLFAPRRVVGIEINPILIHDIVRGHSRAFTGDLYRHPQVTIVEGDGRAELARLRNQRFGLIVANSVATWAAHSSGALNLAEQSLYTTEACGLYLDRLTKTGILSVSLWDVHRHAQPLRWVETCSRAARARGLGSLADHVAVIGSRWDSRSWFSTILLSRAPLSEAQRRKVSELSQRWDFEVHYLPGSATIAQEFRDYFANPSAFIERFPFDVRAATDDQPFFLYTARWGDVLHFWQRDVWEDNAALVNLLLSLLLVSGLLLTIVGGPLLWHTLRSGTRCPLAGREIGYFLLIGWGFMLVEIPLIQRLTLYLGHPTYALTVVLAGLLLASGLGSLLAGRWPVESALARWRTILLLLGALLVVLRFTLDPLLAVTAAWPTLGRITLALALLAPPGVLLGMPLPLGMLELGRREPAAIPWAWGINGASSVVASVAALWLAALGGFRLVFALAIACYAVALLAIRHVRPSSSGG